MTSHYMNHRWPSSLTHICGTRERWVNTYSIGLLQSYQASHMIVPSPMKQPWTICVKLVGNKLWKKHNRAQNIYVYIFWIYCMSYHTLAGSREDIQGTDALVLNSLAPGRCCSIFKSVIFKLISRTDLWSISYEIVLRWMPQDLAED